MPALKKPTAAKPKAQSDVASELGRRIERYHEVSSQRKALEKEEDVLKSYFREQSKGKDVTFEHGALSVLVTEKSRTTLNKDALVLDLGADGIKKYEKTTTYQEVVAKRKETT